MKTSKTKMTHILIVDDEKDNLEALNRLLRNQYTVGVTTSPFEALKVVQRQEFSVVISDQRMPEMTGVDLLEKVKAVSPNTTRILLTGYTDIESVVNAINRGHIYRYIAKPWDPEDLRLTVRQAEEAYLLRSEIEKKSRELEAKNRDLSKALTDLSLLDRAKSRFMSLISHELNTPLTVLGSFSSLLAEEKDDLSPEVRKAANAISGASERLTHIVSEVLSYVKLSGDTQLTLGQHDLSPMIADAVKGLEAPVAAKKITVKKKLEDVQARVDAPRLTQAVYRLLEDAVRRAPEKSEVRIGLEKKGACVCLWVERKGEKISAEEFAPFVAGENEMHHQKNLGLGLSIAKLIVELHGGQIHVVSLKSGETRLEIQLPAEASRAA